MDLINKINYELARYSRVRQMDPRQLPCQFCQEDFYARQEMCQVLSLSKDNSNFAKELTSTYHTMLHVDIKSAKKILYYKDVRTVMGIQILAEKVDGRDGKGKDNLIYMICRDIIDKR